MNGKRRASPFPEPVAPFPGWERRVYRLSRQVTLEDVEAFLDGQELYIREHGSTPVMIVHKYGLFEIYAIPGEREIEVWFSPGNAASVSEYLDALLSTRF